MLKPDSLRAVLTAAVPDLRETPDRLAMVITEGNVIATAVPGQRLAFEYRYKLTALLLEFGGHPDQVFVPMIAWLAVHQNELLANPDKRKDGIAFEAERLDSGRFDVAITLNLTERVAVTAQEDGSQLVEHLPEPPIHLPFPPDVPTDARLWHLYANGEELLHWEAPGLISRPLAPPAPQHG